MSKADDLLPEDDGRRALRRSELLSQNLAEAARRFRISKRSRRVLGTGSFRMRRHARLFRLIYLASFVLIVLVPSVVATIYLGLIASPQYIAEAKFAVRTGELPKVDGVGAATGIPVAKIAQDTQIVANYMTSRAIVEALQQRLDLRHLYSADEIDWYARFNHEKPIEDFVRYWKSMFNVSIQYQSGIVEFSTRAFSAEDARRIADAVIDLSEALVNDMNNRMLRATVSDAEKEFARSASRLSQARIEFQRVRNSEGMLDASQAGKALADLITALQSERLRLLQEYETQRRSVAATAPQMRALTARLGALTDQIAELETRLTTQRTSSAADTVISESMTKFAQQDLDRRIAERQYAMAASALEMARISSEKQMVYLTAFVRPALPQEARYPRRVLFSALIVAGALAAWGALCGGVSVVRNHMA